MSWKVARGLLAVMVGAVVVAGARADDEKPKEKKKEIKVPAHAKKCIEAMMAAGKALNAAAKHCNEKFQGGDKKYLLPLRWQIDTLQTLQVAGNSVVRQGPGHLILCDACARICDNCVRACKGFDEDEMKDCVKACEACAKECRAMIKHVTDLMKKKEKDKKKEGTKKEDDTKKDG